MTAGHLRRTPEVGVARRVWVWADAHIGAESDGLDGGQWLDRAVKDVGANLKPVDYVVSLGDLTDSGKPEQIARYVEIRRNSGLETWHEMAGNHDYWMLGSGLWKQHMALPQRAVLVDGNVVWIMLSVERDGAAGRISPETFQWLRQTIETHKKRNVIVCTHQPVYDTVKNSRKEHRSIFCWVDTGEPYVLGKVPEEELRRIGRMLEEVRVDLWLCCHAHTGPRDAAWSVRKGRTQFINIASINHIYGTGASRSFMMDFKSGSKRLAVKSRNHDQNIFEPEFSINIDFPFPVTLPDLPFAGSMLGLGD